MIKEESLQKGSVNKYRTVNFWIVCVGMNNIDVAKKLFEHILLTPKQVKNLKKS